LAILISQQQANQWMVSLSKSQTTEQQQQQQKEKQQHRKKRLPTGQFWRFNWHKLVQLVNQRKEATNRGEKLMLLLLLMSAASKDLLDRCRTLATTALAARL